MINEHTNEEEDFTYAQFDRFTVEKWMVRFISLVLRQQEDEAAQRIIDMSFCMLTAL
jgi:hypothetical protein